MNLLGEKENSSHFVFTEFIRNFKKLTQFRH